MFDGRNRLRSHPKYERHKAIEDTHRYTWGVIRNFSEVPLFLDSKASRLIQLADIIAYSIFRHFEKGDSSFFSIIEPRFDSEGGIVHGLHIVQ